MHKWLPLTKLADGPWAAAGHSIQLPQFSKLSFCKMSAWEAEKTETSLTVQLCSATIRDISAINAVFFLKPKQYYTRHCEEKQLCPYWS